MAAFNSFLVWYERAMHISRAATAILLCGAAAGAQELEPLIARPLTLPRGTVEITVHGTYTNWAGNAVGTLSSIDGETLALGADFGVSDRVQLGLGVALPVNPGAAFGTVLGSAAFPVSTSVAVRADVGFESFGINGTNTNTSHINRYFGGLGAAVKVPIGPTLAFVSGRTGAVQFGHFNNIGTNGIGLYLGASDFTELASDVLVVSAGDNNSSNRVGINLPVGLLVQPDPHISFTLLSGYSAVINIPNSGSSAALHFIPVGLEAVVAPAPRLDIGARFFVDGYVANSGAGSGSLGYFDLRALTIWMRVRT